MQILEPTTEPSRAVPDLGGSWFHAADWTAADLLPGLYAAALFLLLHALLRKHYDPVPGRVQLLFALILMLLFGSALFGGRVLLPLDNLRGSAPFSQLQPSSPGGWDLQVDLTHEIVPHQAQVRRLLGAGEWPLWNPSVGAGMPLLADPQAQAFQPLILLGYPFPVTVAAGISASLRVLVALTFFFLLLRRQGLAESAALFGSLSYALGGCAMLWLGWPLANAVVLLPAVLYAIVGAVDRGQRRDQALLFGTLLALFCSGHPETTLYAFSLALAFCASKLWARRGSGVPLRLLGRLGAVAALAACVAAPLLLPAQRYLPATERAAVLRAVFDRPLAAALGDLAEPETLRVWRQRAQQRASGVVAARPFGDHQSYWGETNLIDDGAGFAGTLALLFAVAGLLGPRDCAQERCLRWALGGCMLLLLQPPGFDLLTHRLPLVGFTAAHKHRRLLMLVAFAVAYLGACGFDRWRRGALPSRRILLSGLALAAAIAAAYAGNLAGPGLASGYRTAAASAQAAALASAVALLLARPAWRAGAALIAVAAAELLVIHLPANIPNSRHLAYPLTPELQFLKANLGDFRLSGSGPALAPNTASVYGLSDIRTRNPAAPAAYGAVLAGLQSRSPALGKLQHSLYDFLGVRYVIARPGVELALRPVHEGDGAAIFERPGALPRMFLPARGRAVPDNGAQAALDPGFRYSELALFQATADHPGDWSATARRASPPRVRALGAAHARARVHLAEERLLVSSQFQDGSWHLLVDGKSHAAIAANGPFAAAWIPPGRHLVDLLYRSGAFVLGMMVAAAALAAALAWWVAPPAPVRPYPAPQSS